MGYYVQQQTLNPGHLNPEVAVMTTKPPQSIKFQTQSWIHRVCLFLQKNQVFDEMRSTRVSKISSIAIS